MSRGQGMPPEVKEKRAAGGNLDDLDILARQRARAVGFALMVLSAVITMLVLYGFLWVVVHVL